MDTNDNGICDIIECPDLNGNDLCDSTEPVDKDPNEDTCPGGAPCSSPLVINVNGGRWDLADEADPVSFDIDADGVTNRITWTAAGSALAFLAFDRNRNSLIDDGSELFGNWTRLASGSRARNGFEALIEFDSNHDGFVTARDADWSALLLWTDTNHDGASQTHELKSISSTAIRALATRYHWSGRRDRSGNFFGYQGLLDLNGAVRPFYDVYFRAVP